MDLVAESLVSCMAIIEGGFWGLIIKSCMQGMAVLREEAFHVMAYVSRLVSGSCPVGGSKCCVGRGVGWVYSSKGSLYLKASSSNCLGRYGNAVLKL